MQSTLSKWAIAALFSALASGQTPDRALYLNQSATPVDLTNISTMLRTLADVRQITVDQTHKALVSNGTVDQMMLTDWLFQQVNEPAAPGQTAATPEYRMAGENGDVVRVFRMQPSAANADVVSPVTAIRTMAEAQRTFPFSSQKAVVVRSSVDKMDAAEWLFHQLCPPVGETPPADSPAYTMAGLRGEEVIRVFRLAPRTSNQGLTDIVTAIRTVFDVQRLFPYEASTAVAMRGPSDKVAAAGWLIHELGKPAATHQYILPGVTDGDVRLFDLAPHGSAPELTALITQIRATTQIQRIFPLGSRQALVLRDRPDQVATAEGQIARFNAGGLH